MKPLYSLSELQELGQAHLQELGVKKLFATGDGQFFILENRARLHAGPNGKTYEITSSEEAPGGGGGGDEQQPTSIKDLTKEVSGISDLEVLRGMLTAEAAGPNRKGAISAIEGRMQAIVAATGTHTKTEA